MAVGVGKFEETLAFCFSWLRNNSAWRLSSFHWRRFFSASDSNAGAVGDDEEAVV